MKLRGVPAHRGTHKVFTDQDRSEMMVGKKTKIPKRYKLKGVPSPKGKYKKFED